MLKGRVLDLYFKDLCEVDNPLDFHAKVSHVKDYVETKEIRHAYLSELRDLTSQQVIQEYPTKTKSDCFEILLRRPKKVQRALSTVQQTRIYASAISWGQHWE